MLRYPSSAGFLYPDSPMALRGLVNSLLDMEPPLHVNGKLRALVSPHSSYRFAGEIAGSAFRLLQIHAGQFEKVLILGPSHRVAFPGVALPPEDTFLTPLGNISIDEELRESAKRIPGVGDFPGAHNREHSIEVQLPFLQQTLGTFSMLPLLVGNCPPVVLAEIIENLAPDSSVLVVISSELSHGNSPKIVHEQNQSTIDAILNLDPSISPHQASGAIALNGLISLAKRKNWNSQVLGLKVSGEMGDSQELSVGFGAFAFLEP